MRTFNFIGDTTYTTREGISYRIDNKEHNIQRVGKSWVVDGKASSLEEMVKMGIAKNIARVYNSTSISKVVWYFVVRSFFTNSQQGWNSTQTQYH